MEKWTHLKRLANVEFWDLALARAGRSFLQGIAVSLAGGLTPWVELDWPVILLGGAGMFVASLVNSAIKVLPEEEQD